MADTKISADPTVTPAAGDFVPIIQGGVNKKATAGSVAALGGLEAGMIVKGAVAPTGCLYCDGSLLDQATYTTLYAKVGYGFSPYANRYKVARPWQQQYMSNMVQSGDITGWVLGTALPGNVMYSAAVVTSSRVYLIGGHDGTNFIATVYTAPINADGTLGAWTTGTALPGVLGYSQAVVTSSRVYLIGGHDATNYLATVYTAPINADGTLGAWTTGTALPGAAGVAQTFITTGRVYVVGGGQNAGRTSAVYYAPINADGTLGAWVTDAAFPTVLGESQVIVTNSRVYILGGNTGTPSNLIYTATISTAGAVGKWELAPMTLPVATWWGQVITTHSRVYLIGGLDGASAYSTAVYTAPINADGTLGAWTTQTPIPVGIGMTQVITTSARVYILGGNTNTAVYVANFSGGLNAYMDQTFDAATPPANKFYIPDLRYTEALTMQGVKNYIKY